MEAGQKNKQRQSDAEPAVDENNGNQRRLGVSQPCHGERFQADFLQHHVQGAVGRIQNQLPQEADHNDRQQTGQEISDLQQPRAFDLLIY
ncbi:hypothetical protein D3C73_1141230 [compost metagenome]